MNDKSTNRTSTKPVPKEAPATINVRKLDKLETTTRTGPAKQ